METSTCVPGIDTEEQVDRSPTGCLLEGLIQALVAGVCRAPDLVLQGLVDIVLGVRLDDEVTRLQ